MAALTITRDSLRSPLPMLVLALLAQFALPAAGLSVVFGAARAQPYRCLVDGAKRPVHTIDQEPGMEGGPFVFRSAEVEPVAWRRFVLGVLASKPPVMIVLSKTKDDDGVTYQLTLDASTVSIARMTPEGLSSTWNSSAAPAELLAASSLRYFWVEVSPASHTVSFGRAGEVEPLVSLRDDNFEEPMYMRFRSGAMWLHSCTSGPQPNRESCGCGPSRLSAHLQVQLQDS
ncbi:Isopentenyl-diphosphate Delta-isomerase 2 [Frankliniella fusca]|uniref:Isopentenyl-diphosphate Delta-isomerase 2 n=1 Tax=Frankliniella fusca TaxID=407009 RepID=A0AAE1LAM0_9NEOP|nr:Isopentenyl-diphosphate Delta-isomerase 2 [Frankliniella fusca]